MILQKINKIVRIKPRVLKILKYTIMGKQCSLCGRSSIKAASRSHSNIKTLRRQYANLQSKKVEGVKSLVCTRCIKTSKKNTAKASAK